MKIAKNSGKENLLPKEIGEASKRTLNSLVESNRHPLSEFVQILKSVDSFSSQLAELNETSMDDGKGSRILY